MDINDALFHLGEGTAFPDIPAAPPLYQTSNFVFNSFDDMQTCLKREDKSPFYSRGANPTVQILQQKLAALEATDEALVFGSGSAAVAAAILSQVKAGDHISCVANPYGWTKKLLSSILKDFGVTHDYVPAHDTDALLAAVKPETKVIFLESPNSWTYEMQDLERVSAFAKARGITTIIDNSCASPLNQQPAIHGIDIMVHSASKYLSGHADMVAGVLCTSSTIAMQIFQGPYMTMGGILSPFESWLMIRSLRTLEMRMDRVAENALVVGEYLENHPKVSKLYFTHAKSYPQPELRDKYLKKAGGLMTIELATTELNKVKAFCNQLERFKLGCSWGGFESLAFPAATTTGSLNYHSDETPVNRIRLYVGLENPKLLIEDLSKAFDAL